MAQLEARLATNQEAGGSSPSIPDKSGGRQTVKPLLLYGRYDRGFESHPPDSGFLKRIEGGKDDEG